MNTQIIDELLSAMIRTGDGVSDLLFTIGKPPYVESHGCLSEFPIKMPATVLGSEEIDQLADHIINNDERLRRDLVNLGSCDCSYALKGLARFRVNIFKQNGRQAIVMRKLQSKIPTLEMLGLPPVFHEIIKERNGIVFVTGATGSGKTTTLAAMLNEINQTQPIHIVTLEDPIEFLHPHGRAIFHQRELGKDFPDFVQGLRAALRQAPKVILVGEIRDRATMEIAMTASETGHLVFTTLHTISAGQTINRILGMFAKDEEQMLRQRLADTVRYVVSQRLVSKIGGGRLLLTEIMGNSMRTRETLLYGEGENRTFQEIIEAGSSFGWHSFDQSLLKAYESGFINEETALIFCTHKHKMRRDVDMLKKLKAKTFEAPSGLQLQDTIKVPAASIPQTS
ncbi:MAG TPA: PilT/PilU family type 4a pilus ATPase [Chthoniobacterales bacterium]|jgi:twitching motility protein PilT|nr:PilT/PilU family type 4a pilus ATPase [Chthoniobacterales bacterium]